MGTYFICRFIGLKDVYLNVAPPLSGVPDTWLGDANDNLVVNEGDATGYLDKVNFHIKAEYFDAWKNIFDDTSMAWNTTNVEFKLISEN
jgi:hypothetical protein